ncbi:MAG: hypothetical protein K2P49_06270 [Oscillospiraceae bacterium]|nr:hypothetical protein [Oscillospiraceae bacterium]
MEIDARRQLIAELDKSLLAHAAALGQKEGGPTIGDAYELQDMAERHYYLKVEHEFTAAEVEALLSFADPLAVACACWEENDHKHSFPICEIIDNIRAYERFPAKQEEDSIQRQAWKLVELKIKIDQEMADYRASLLCMRPEELIDKSGEITAMREALDFLTSGYDFQKGDAEMLLNMEKPLHFVASLWPSELDTLLDLSDLISEELGTAKAYQHESVPASQEPAQPEKQSLRDQLRAAMRETHQRPPQEGRSQRQPDTPNL